MKYEEVRAAVYALIPEIPEGHVATYGQLAVMIGAPQLSRMVGRAMGEAPHGLPCHRVVGSSGRMVPGWAEQELRLAEEGVTFTPGGAVRLRLHQWRPWEAEEA